MFSVLALLFQCAGPSVLLPLLAHPAPPPPPGSDNYLPSQSQVATSYLVFHVLPWVYVGVSVLAVLLGHLSLLRLPKGVRWTSSGVGAAMLIVSYAVLALNLLFALAINFVQV